MDYSAGGRNKVYHSVSLCNAVTLDVDIFQRPEKFVTIICFQTINIDRATIWMCIDMWEASQTWNAH